MADYYKRCEKARTTVCINGATAWWCACHEFDTMLPLPPSVLVIEDGIEVIENCEWCPEERVTLPAGTTCSHGVPCSVVLRAVMKE